MTLKNIIMKRLSITFMAILCFLLSVSVNADDNSRTKLTTRNESFTGTNSGGVYRGFDYDVTLELITSAHLVEISHFGIGDAEVYLLDHRNQIVEEITIYEGSSKDYLRIPVQSGDYKVVIWSCYYYGEAYFKM